MYYGRTDATNSGFACARARFDEFFIPLQTCAAAGTSGANSYFFPVTYYKLLDFIDLNDG